MDSLEEAEASTDQKRTAVAYNAEQLLRRHIFDTPFRMVDCIILATLARSPQHGYALEAIVTNATAGRVMPGNSSVYKALSRLRTQGQIQLLPHDPEDRRKYYDLTPAGRSQLARDLALLRRVLRAYDLRF